MVPSSGGEATASPATAYTWYLSGNEGISSPKSLAGAFFLVPGHVVERGYGGEGGKVDEVSEPLSYLPQCSPHPPEAFAIKSLSKWG